MKVKFGLENIPDIQATMQFTMPIGEWKRVRMALRGEPLLPHYHPASKIAVSIEQMIAKSEKELVDVVSDKCTVGDS